MNLTPAVVKSLLMAAAIGMVVPIEAQTAPKPATPKQDKAKPKIEGITIPRADGRFLGLTVDGVQFKLRFYDAEKKPETPDVLRAAARWVPVNVKAEQRAVLNLSDDGTLLISPGLVRPPLTFRAFFTLFSAKAPRRGGHPRLVRRSGRTLRARRRPPPPRRWLARRRAAA